VRATPIQGSYDVFVKDKLEVLSGLKAAAPDDAKDPCLARASWTGDSPSAAIGWARRRGGPPAASYLAEFAKEMKTVGVRGPGDHAPQVRAQPRCLTKKSRSE